MNNQFVNYKNSLKLKELGFFMKEKIIIDDYRVNDFGDIMTSKLLLI